MTTNTKYTGKDNYGKQKSDFINKLSEMDNHKLFETCKEYIWLSAYASNNLRSDYHWKCDACYDESEKRKTDIYSNAHKAVTREAGY